MNTINERATTIKKTSTSRGISASSVLPSKRSASIALSSTTRHFNTTKKLFQNNNLKNKDKNSKFDLRTYTDIVKLNNDGVNSLERKNYVEALRMFRKAYDHVISKVTVDKKPAKISSITHNKRRKIHKNNKKSSASKAVSAASLTDTVDDVDHTKENNFNTLIHSRILHCYETNNMDYFIDIRKKRRYHYHFDNNSNSNESNSTSMFRRRSSLTSSRGSYYFSHSHHNHPFGSGIGGDNDDDSIDVNAIINMNDVMNNNASQPSINSNSSQSSNTPTEQPSQQQQQHHNTHQLVHTSYITEVEKEFHIFNHGLRINQPTSTETNERSTSIILPSSIEELNKLLSLLLYNIGKVFQHVNQLDDALEIYRKSISLVSCNKKVGDENDDIISIDSDDTATDEDNSITSSTIINETTTKLAILHSMGQIYFQQSKTDDSIEAYKTAKSIIDYKLQNKKNNTIMSLLSSTTINCINVLKKYQEFVINPDDALTATLQANIDNQNNNKENVEEDDESSTTTTNDDSSSIINQYKQIALFYTNIALQKFRRMKYNAAITNFTTALTIYRNIYGNNSLDVGICLYYLGQVYYIKNELDVAIRYFVQYFDIAKKNKRLSQQNNQQQSSEENATNNESTTNINLDIASVCCYLGKVFHKKQQLEYALIYYNAALGIYKKIFGESSLQVACLLNKVGFIYYDNDLYDLALKCCKSQWAMEKKFYMSTSTETTSLNIKSKSENNFKNIIITLLNIADIHLKKYQYASSLEFYRKVLGLQKKMYIDTKDHPEIIETMNRIGYVLYLKGDYNKCFKIFIDSLRIHFHTKRNMPFDTIVSSFRNQVPSPIATKTMYDIGKTLFTIGDLDTALSCFTLSLNMNLNLLKSTENNEITSTTSSVLSYAVIDQFDVLITLYDVARIHYHKGDVNAALETLIMLTNIYNNQNKNNAQNKDNVVILIRALSFAANIYCLYHEKDTSKKTKMMEYYIKAVRLCRKYGISEYDDSILLPLDVKIYSIDIDYPLAAPVA